LRIDKKTWKKAVGKNITKSSKDPLPAENSNIASVISSYLAPPTDALTDFCTPGSILDAFLMHLPVILIFSLYQNHYS
jgi:hypothetical protein